jgi:cysteinyl-tRNA synthetase
MGTINQDVWAALLDDLNTPLALVHIEALIRKIRENGYLSEDVNQLYASVVFLGLMDADHLAAVDLPSPGEIEALLAKRELARKSKNFKVADQIRQSLLKQGVEILDTAGKSTWKYRL